jgi:hypothetical protein
MRIPLRFVREHLETFDAIEELVPIVISGQMTSLDVISLWHVK